MGTHNANPACEPLRVSGDSIVNATGERVVLKGTALGGDLNMENFITSYSGHEHEHRAALAGYRCILSGQYCRLRVQSSQRAS
jgi:hypothetical protein